MNVGQKSGYCILWWGTVRCGDNFEPEVYNYEVEFNLPDLAEGNKHGYLVMMTYGVNYRYNKLYMNNNYVWKLLPRGNNWGFDCFLINGNFLKKGINKFKLTARNSAGGYTGEVDDIWVRDPVLFYPTD